MSDYAANAAWNRMKEYLFIQGAEVETRPLSQEAMHHILMESLKAYDKARKA